MHVDFWHLFWNMVGAWNSSRLVAMTWGVPTLMALWMGAGLTGGVASLTLSKKEEKSEQMYLGASGSVLGLFAVIACQAPRHRIMFLFIASLAYGESLERL